MTYSPYGHRDGGYTRTGVDDGVHDTAVANATAADGDPDAISERDAEIDSVAPEQREPDASEHAPADAFEQNGNAAEHETAAESVVDGGADSEPSEADESDNEVDDGGSAMGGEPADSASTDESASAGESASAEQSIGGTDEEAAADETAAANDETATDETATDETATDETATDEETAPAYAESDEATATDATATDATATDEPATDEAVTDEPGTDEAATDSAAPAYAEAADGAVADETASDEATRDEFDGEEPAAVPVAESEDGTTYVSAASAEAADDETDDDATEAESETYAYDLPATGEEYVAVGVAEPVGDAAEPSAESETEPVADSATEPVGEATEYDDAAAEPARDTIVVAENAAFVVPDTIDEFAPFAGAAATESAEEPSTEAGLLPGEAPVADPVPAALANADATHDRWHQVQLAFIDDPRGSVEAARGLVADAVEARIAAIRDRQTALDAWQQDNAPDTEVLRAAMQSYREMLNALTDGE